MTLDDFFAGQEEPRLIFETLRGALDAIGEAELRVKNSQIAFRRRRASAWAWMPGTYLRGRYAPLVLTISLRRRDSSLCAGSR